MNSAAVTRALTRISSEILERHGGASALGLVGIHTRGVPLAERLARKLHRAEGEKVPVGSLDITLYRDDLVPVGPQPVVGRTDVSFEMEDKDIVLVDDVLFTGRTVRAALDALFALGRPRSIQLAVLIDRGHRELPVAADYVGKKIETGKDELVQVRLKEIDEADGVDIEPPPGKKR
ncbi:MAG: bifunctional pyr operon transcriptional regulator/uracil phosphoribosyltransferase PyrR [Acidobacteriota bacterium]